MTIIKATFAKRHPLGKNFLFLLVLVRCEMKFRSLFKKKKKNSSRPNSGNGVFKSHPL